MSQKIKATLFHALPAIIISTVLVVAIVFAWTEPSVTPPGANVPAPLNVGNAGQSKAGGLILNTGGAATGLIVDKGNVGIGTTGPQDKLDIVNGNLRIWDSGVTTLNKFDSQGVALTSNSHNIILNGLSEDRPEISWYRGNRQYPEFSIREHATADTGVTFWVGNGQSPLSAAISIVNNGNVGIGTTGPSQKLDVSGQIHATGDICTDAGGGKCLSVAGGAGTGDITAVYAGSGLSGGGASGDVTLSADASYLQRRVAGTCASNQAIRVIYGDGSVSCVNVPASVPIVCSWAGRTYSPNAQCHVVISNCANGWQTYNRYTCLTNGTWAGPNGVAAGCGTLNICGN